MFSQQVLSLSSAVHSGASNNLGARGAPPSLAMGRTRDENGWTRLLRVRHAADRTSLSVVTLDSNR